MMKGRRRYRSGGFGRSLKEAGVDDGIVVLI